MSRGIDYGMGRTNIDRETGIRFGVISQNEVLQAWADSSEADYGSPCCPKCGNEAVNWDDDRDETENRETIQKALKLFGFPADSEVDFCEDGSAYVGLTQILPPGTHAEEGRDMYKVLHHACGDYACDSCKVLFDGEDAFSDEALGYTLDDGEYKATSGSDGDIFILKSPYYTRAQFCSPCAPGACYLTNPCDDGEKAYCFGQDWFDDEYPCPYPIYRVSDNSLVYSPKQEEETDE